MKDKYIENKIKIIKNCRSNKEKFECSECGCFYWVEDRNNFICPNCEDIK